MASAAHDTSATIFSADARLQKSLPMVAYYAPQFRELDLYSHQRYPGALGEGTGELRSSPPKGHLRQAWPGDRSESGPNEFPSSAFDPAPNV